MPFRYFRNRFRKDIMNKNGFLTYRNGLTLTAPGSGQRTIEAGWRIVPDFGRRLSNGVSGIAMSAETAFREMVLGNLLMMLFVAYAITRTAVPAVSGAFSGLWNSAGVSVKRLTDVLGAAVGLLLISPLLAVVAIAIKLDSEGSVFFTQLRIGRNRRRAASRSGCIEMLVDVNGRDRRRKDLRGMPFKVYKFRSMMNDAERKSGPIWATKDDPRITRVGRLLRKTRLDEVPQLLNVLKGEMSLVGPRPERPVFVESLSRDIEDYEKRLSVKPGITGLAQVITGYDTSVSSVREKVKQDISYIENWTIVKDIKILLRTVIVVITGKGAF